MGLTRLRHNGTKSFCDNGMGDYGSAKDMLDHVFNSTERELVNEAKDTR